MSILTLIIKALDVLKTEEGWYDFNTLFWKEVEPKLTLQLVYGTKNALSFLQNQFDKKLLSMCKHKDKSDTYETYQVCYECHAQRTREPADGGQWSNPWSEWHF